MYTERAAHLLEALRAASGSPELTYTKAPETLNGGFYAQLFSFSLKDPPQGWPADLVARVMPNPDLAKKETAVQDAVASAGYPTPMVRASGGIECGLGGSFLVMDLVHGKPLLAGIDGLSAVVSALPTLRRIPDLLASSMADLHALDPELVRVRLDGVANLPITLTEFIVEMSKVAAQYERIDLAGAADWFVEHPLPASPDVICHGDLHPLNLMMEGNRAWVLDWSTTLLAPRILDVGYTSLLLEEPPLVVPRPLDRVVRGISNGLARQFLRGYQQQSGTTVVRKELEWHQGVTCLRALVEVSGWARDDAIDTRTGHPWLISERSFASRLSALTGVDIRAI